jgi:hypothetical protein
VADIFLSYASPDRDRARLLADALERLGWSVWWDRVIPPGRVFDEVIEESLTAARCVIVLWSTASIASDWVKTEAAEAAARRVLVPALIDHVKIPLEFRRFQAADLTAWTGAPNDAEFAKLAASVAPLLGRAIEPTLRTDESRTRNFLSVRARAVAAVAIVLVSAALALWKSTANVTVPSLLGQRIDQARSAIASAKLIAGAVTEEATDKQAPGTVLKQNPSAGSEAKKGASVALVVASTPAPPAQTAAAASLSPIDPSLGGLLSLGVAFDAQPLALHVMFVPDKEVAGLLTGGTGPGAAVIRLDAGPAMKAGMRAGDVITAIAGAPIRSEDDLRQALKKIGNGVTQFTIKRGAQELKVDVECNRCN